MKLIRILPIVALLCCFTVAQQPGNDGSRPFQFQSLNQQQPPQSFQRINFFGPLQQQQQQPSDPFRNPFFIPSVVQQGPQDPRAGQRNSGEFTLSAKIQQTPANTGTFRQQDPSSPPKPLFQFQFGTNTERQLPPIAGQQRAPFRPSVSADQPDAPVRPIAQLPAQLPVPLALRPRTQTPRIELQQQQQRTEATPVQRVRPAEPVPPIRAPPTLDSREEATSTSAERRESPAFQQRITRPIESPRQSLGDEPTRDDRQLRNRLRRPDSSTSAEAVQTTRRTTVLNRSPSSTESSSEVADVTTTSSVAGRGRIRVSLSSSEVDTLTTARPRGAFLRGRTTTFQPQTTSSEIELLTDEPVTRRPLFGGRRRPNSAEITTEKPKENSASVVRIRNNGHFRLRGRVNPEDSSELPVTTSSERSVEDSISNTTPPASANAVDGPSSDRPAEEEEPGEEEDDDVIGADEEDEEDDFEEEDNESTPEATSSTTTTTSTTTTEAPASSTTLLTTTSSTPTTTETSVEPTSTTVTTTETTTTTTTTPVVTPQEPVTSAKEAEQVAAEEQPEAGPEEDADQRRPAKLEIFNLGQSNTTSVNLDNVVFVPNLFGLQVQPRVPTSTSTLSPSVETSRSVVSVEQSADAQGERQSKAIDANRADSNNALFNKQTVSSSAKDEAEVPSIEEKSAAETSESSIDELDRLQSGLFNKHLTNLTNNLNAGESADKPIKTTTSTEVPLVSSRAPFRPSFERPRHPMDILNQPRSTTTSATPSASESTTTTESTTVVETTTLSLFDRLFKSKAIVKDDMSALLPPDFALPQEPQGPPAPTTEASTTATTTTTEAAKPFKPFNKLFGGVSVKFDDVSSFLPPGFKMPEAEPESTTTTTTSTTTAKSGIEGLLGAAVLDDLSGLLPPGFKQHLFTPPPSKTTGESTTEPTTESSVSSTTTRLSGVVFPTRASPARNVTTEKPRSKPTYSPIEIKTGWPVRATTEFTGWPSPPTPVPTLPSTSTTAKTTTTARTTTSTTTTTTTPRVTTPGVCGELCRLAGTVRLVEGVEWVPELRDHNTREWNQLANAIENELDEAYQNGPLAPWYTGIVVEAFSRGSVLVDYYLMLNGTADLDTGEIRNYFHLSLDTQGEHLKLGNYTVDPKSTDFIVVPQGAVLGDKERVATGAVSEWVIAVIVVSLASLIFVIAFGTTMMIRRRRQHKRKSVPLTEEMLNELNKNHMSNADNSSGESFYDVGDAWDHRTALPTKPIKPLPRPASVNAIRSHGTSGFANYHNNYNNFGGGGGNQFGRPQLHDFWKSEWDSAHYYDHSNSSTAQRIKAVPRPATSYGRYPTYGRPRPDYDDDF